MKTKLTMKPSTGLRTQTTIYFKIAASIGILGIIATGIFFAIGFLGSSKDSLAENGSGDLTTEKSLVFSEIALKGHKGSKYDRYIEIYNMTDSAIDLSDYSIYCKSYSGWWTFNSEVKLSGNIEANDYYVVSLFTSVRSESSKSKIDNNCVFEFFGLNQSYKAFFVLKKDEVDIDYIGNENNLLKVKKNYDRVDYLSNGIDNNLNWAQISNTESTPGSINTSDVSDLKIYNNGDAGDFGKNSSSNPGISIKSNGTVNLGKVEIKIQRGKKVDSDIKMINRIVDIEAENQPDDVELKYYYHDSELNGIEESSLALYSYYDDEWHFVGGEVDTENNVITATGVNHFSLWSAASKEGNSLPVSLISFNGKKDNETVVLNWKTATEINNDYFTIEQSEDGIDYEAIGRVIGSGNSNSVIEYSFTDYEPANGINYYRLTQTDYDGKFETFPPIVIKNSSAASTTDENIKINRFGPNPFIDNVTINFESSFDGEISINIYNSQGALVRNKQYNCVSGMNNYTVNSLSSLAQGTYLLQITSDLYKSKAIRLIKN